jgi:hypothetical protein
MWNGDRTRSRILRELQVEDRQPPADSCPAKEEALFLALQETIAGSTSIEQIKISGNGSKVYHTRAGDLCCDIKT